MPMTKSGNFLQMKVQDKIHRSQPQNIMAQKELDYMNENPNYLQEQYEVRRRQKLIQYSKDLMDWASKSLNYISPEEYPKFRETAISYGMKPEMLPEKFDAPEAFEDFKMRTAVGLPEYKKLLDGKPVTLSKITEDGLINTVEAKPKEMAAYFKDGYSLGKLSGTPGKKQFDHKAVYNSEGRLTGYKAVEKGKDFTFKEGEYGNAPDKSKSSAPTPQQALRRISDIQKARATLEKTDVISLLMAKNNPELKDMAGQKINPELKQQLNEAWDNEIAYLQQFTTGKPKDSGLPEGLTQEMLNQYKIKYPDKTEDEIKNAWKNRKQ